MGVDVRISAAAARATRLFWVFNTLLVVTTTVVTGLIFLPPVQLSQNFVLGLVTLDGLLITSSAAIYTIAVRPLRESFTLLRTRPDAVRIAVELLRLPIVGNGGRRADRIIRVFLNVGEFGIASLALFPPFLAAVLALAALLRLSDQTAVVLSVPGILTVLAVWVTVWHAIFLLPYLAWIIYTVRTMAASSPS